MKTRTLKELFRLWIEAYTAPEWDSELIEKLAVEISNCPGLTAAELINFVLCKGEWKGDGKIDYWDGSLDRVLADRLESETVELNLVLEYLKYLDASGRKLCRDFSEDWPCVMKGIFQKFPINKQIGLIRKFTSEKEYGYLQNSQVNFVDSMLSGMEDSLSEKSQARVLAGFAAESHRERYCSKEELCAMLDGVSLLAKEKK